LEAAGERDRGGGCMAALAILGNLDPRARIVFVRMDKRIREEEIPGRALHYCFS